MYIVVTQKQELLDIIYTNKIILMSMISRILIVIVSHLAIAGSAMGQTLNVAPIQTEAGKLAELVVSIKDNDVTMTALQFNLSLPTGMTIVSNDVILGEATNNHTLDVETLENGDHLFILYSMNLNTIQDGELLRIPVNIDNEVTDGTAKLYTIRFADTNAVSHSAADVDALVTGITPQQIANDKMVNSKCYDLSGREIVYGKSSNSKLTKGIFIKDGKKVLVK